MHADPRSASSEPVVARLVETVAAREGVDPNDLPERVHDVVDTDALESLFNSERGHVVFPFCDYRVTVFADGRMDVETTT